MVSPTRDVLVIHPHSVRRAALASALPAHRVVAVESKLEAARRMEDSAPSLIVSSPEDARPFMMQVERVAPNSARVFVCSQADPLGLEELMRAAAEGHDFSVVDDSLTGPALGRTLNHLLHGRQSARLLLGEPLEARLRVAGRLLAARCLELGNFGATLQLMGPIEPSLFLPGRVLEDVLIQREGRTVLRAPCPQVQQMRLPGTGERGGLLLTVSWASVLQPSPQGPSFRIESEEVRLTLQQAIERKSLLWLSLTSAEVPLQVCLDSPQLGRELEQPVLVAWPRVPLQVVPTQRLQLFFEMGGQSYSGQSWLLRLLPDGGLMLALPALLQMRNWRTLPRFKPPADQPFLISFSTPGGRQQFTRSLLDLSCGGLSFPFDPSTEVLPAGSRLEASLLLPDGSAAPCPLEVRSIQALPSQGPVDGGLRPFRAGARFLQLPSEARDAILRAFVASRSEGVVDGGAMPFEEVWRLMKEARYNFHPDYPFGSPRPVMQALEHTHRQLYGSLDLGCCLVHQDERGVLGQVAGLRIHSRTWLVQHLAVLPSFNRQESISHVLTPLQVELGEAQEDIEYIRYSWRQDNRWPNRLASWLAASMGNHGLTLRRSFHYMRRPLPPGPLPPLPPQLPRVREATAHDRLWLEQHLRERGERVRLYSEDLLADSLELEELGRRFQARGLQRSRRLLVVDGDHQPLALALVEQGSPGLNLIEKTNAFGLVLPEPGHPHARAAAHALIQHCLRLANQRRRPSAVVLAPDEHVPLLAEAGFVDMGCFSDWIFHRSLVRRWCELVRSLLDRLLRKPSSGSRAELLEGDGCT